MALGPVWGTAILVVQVSVIAFVAFALLPREARGAATGVPARDEENGRHTRGVGVRRRTVRGERRNAAH